MRIVSLKDFLKLPPGTVFQTYTPCTAEALEIKESSWDDGRTYVYQELDGSSCIECKSSDDMMDALLDMDSGASYPIDLDSCKRDSLCNDDQRFLIWESADVKALISRLQDALTSSQQNRD